MSVVVYSPEDTGASDMHSVGGVWSDGATTTQFGLAGGGVVALNLIIPAYTHSTRSFRTVAFAATIQGTAGTARDRTVILSMYNDFSTTTPSGGNTALIGAAANFTPIASMVTPATGTFDNIDMTMDVTLFNSKLRNSQNTAFPATFLVHSPDLGGVDSITLFAAEHATGAAPTITVDDFPVITGKSGPWKAQGRVARCPRCGFLVTKDVLINDGFVKGLRICPRCYDPPEDRANRRLPLERDREGEGRWGR